MLYRSATVLAANAADPQSIDVPAGVQDGDLLLLLVASDDAGADITVPSGWTEITLGVGGTEGLNLNAFAAWRIASSEPASYSLDLDTVGAEVGFMIAFDSEGGTPQIDDSDFVVDDTGNTAQSSPSVTVESDGFLVAMWVHDGIATVSSAPSGMTLIGFADPDGSSHAAAYYEATSGAQSRSLTWSASDQLLSVAVAISAAGDGGSDPSVPYEDIVEAGDSWTADVVSDHLFDETWTEGSEHGEGFSTFELFLNDDEGAHGGDEWIANVSQAGGIATDSIEDGASLGDSFVATISAHALLDEGAVGGDPWGVQQFPPVAGNGAQRMHIRTGLGI